MKLLTCALLLALLPGMVVAETRLYKYTDENGRVHFTDRPPADVATESITIKSYDGPVDITDYSSALKPDTDKKVVMYMTEWCGYCKKASRYMDANNIPYTEYDIEKSTRANSEHKRLDGKGVPLILVGKKKMSGFNAGRLEGLLADQ